MKHMSKAILLALALSIAGVPLAQAGGAGDEWESLNQEVEELYRTGKYDSATLVAQKALQLAEQNADADHPDVATSLNNLASLYDAQGDYAKAEPLYKRALAIREKALGPDHPDVATSLNNLAELYRTQGDYAKAEPLYKRSLAIREKALGPDHPDVATSLNNLAVALRYPRRLRQGGAALQALTGDLGEGTRPRPSRCGIEPEQPGGALRCPRRLRQGGAALQALAGDPRESARPDHPDVATSLNNLAELYRTQGDYAKAEPLYKRSLAIREKALGPDHPDVAIEPEQPGGSSTMIRATTPRQSRSTSARWRSGRRRSAPTIPMWRRA